MDINFIKKRYLILIGVILFFAFIIFSYFVAKERFTKLDFDLTVKFQDKIPRRLDYPFSWFSVLGSAEVTGIIWLGILILLLLRKLWLPAASLLLLPAALGIEIFGKLFVQHPAPPFMFYRGVLSIEFPSNYVPDLFSYPSGHVTRTAFLIIFLMSYVYFRRKPQFQIIVIPLLLGILFVMCVSRIYLGEHWSSDVFGGLMIGTSFGLIAGTTIPVKHSKIKKEIIAAED